MEKLELKHIAPYLPYRLKGYIPETIYVEDIVDGENYSYDIEPQIVEILGVTRESSFQGECIFFRGDADGYVEFEDIKIILRPLSDLIKPCLEGSKIPMFELGKIAGITGSMDLYEQSLIFGYKYQDTFRWDEDDFIAIFSIYEPINLEILQGYYTHWKPIKE